ncbi:SDR family oxidoreductase [Amycolatopsis sp., V23-08]|uniref:SDR family oxidoreductase n=1 Tax=Amycolatopsis heterodermiae TaxID=3110235 RepID=A0ABU5RC63_9PSEU|nr:SDR family oxidoreductase [Amycolatopsis sp., V23-08]MEA5363847.1 SDR family oxidoreductase [Amycolatopsis sp., V23-08]
MAGLVVPDRGRGLALGRAELRRRQVGAHEPTLWCRILEVARRLGGLRRAGQHRHEVGEHEPAAWCRIPVWCGAFVGAGELNRTGARSVGPVVPDPGDGAAPQRASAGRIASACRAGRRGQWGPRGVRVNAVSPAVTRTDMSAAAFTDPDLNRILTAQYALSRLGEPEDVAQAVLFFASPASSFVTGQLLSVDGGWEAALVH